MMTVFAWTPRIGQMAKESDPKMYAHYKKEVDKQRDNWY